MAQIIRLLIHIAPILAAILSYKYLAIALLLFVVVCYVKVFKLQAKINDLQGDLDPSSFEKTKNWWKRLTFLRN